MVIFKIINTSNGKSYYNVALNGYTFAAKLREVLYGVNDRFGKYYPIYNDVVNGDRFDVVVCEINTPPEKINSRMIELISENQNNYNGAWIPLLNHTIENHYKRMELWDKEQGQDLYDELGKAFGYKTLTTIVFDYIYCHATEDWLKTIFKLSDMELGIILKGLPIYLNLMNFEIADKTIAQAERRGNDNGIHTYDSPRQRFRMSSDME